MSQYPILFEANEKEFKTHGIGVLSDAVQCDVTEELNGIFELTMVYPSSGKYLKELKKNRLIYADASKELGFQPFRICRVNKLLSGLINVYAQHISYDLGGIQLPPFETLGTSDGMQKVKTYSTTQNDYSFSSTMIVDETDENNAFKTETPKSVRAYLLGEKESFLQAYGGEFTFDRFNVRHSTLRGSDKGFRVKYGVNMVDLNQEESIEKTYTGIFPYYKDEYMFMDLTESYDLMYPHEVDTSKLAGKILYAEGSFAHTKIANVDLSPYFEVAPLSTDELKEIAEKYMKDNSIGIPKASIDVRFESLRNSPEYSNVIFLEDVFLGDTIHVDYIKLGVSATGRINSIIYDSLRHKNKRVSIGDPKNNVADTLISITNSVKGSETNILGMSRSIAKINLLTNENSASLELLVETQKDGKKAVRGSVLVEAINGQDPKSAVSINADYLNLDGYVTISSLQDPSEDNKTIIDGSRIQTGQIYSKDYSNEYIVIADSSLNITEMADDVDTDPYYYSCFGESIAILLNDYFSNAVSFRLSQEFVENKGYQIRLYKDLKIELLWLDTILETTTATKSSLTSNDKGKTVFKADPKSYFSASGSMFDLEKGTIQTTSLFSSYYAASFGGSIKTKEKAEFGNISIWNDEITANNRYYYDEDDPYTGWSENILTINPHEIECRFDVHDDYYEYMKSYIDITGLEVTYERLKDGNSESKTYSKYGSEYIYREIPYRGYKDYNGTSLSNGIVLQEVLITSDNLAYKIILNTLTNTIDVIYGTPS